MFCPRCRATVSYPLPQLDAGAMQATAFSEGGLWEEEKEDPALKKQLMRLVEWVDEKEQEQQQHHPAQQQGSQVAQSWGVEEPGEQQDSGAAGLAHVHRIKNGADVGQVAGAEGGFGACRALLLWRLARSRALLVCTCRAQGRA